MPGHQQLSALLDLSHFSIRTFDWRSGLQTLRGRSCLLVAISLALDSHPLTSMAAMEVAGRLLLHESLVNKICPSRSVLLHVVNASRCLITHRLVCGAWWHFDVHCSPKGALWTGLDSILNSLFVFFLGGDNSLFWNWEKYSWLLTHFSGWYSWVEMYTSHIITAYKFMGRTKLKTAFHMSEIEGRDEELQMTYYKSYQRSFQLPSLASLSQTDLAVK